MKTSRSWLVPFAVLLMLVPLALADPVYTLTAQPSLAPPASVLSLAWAPDESLFATGGCTTPYLTLYAISAGAFIKQSDPSTIPNSCVEGMAFSPNGQWLIVGMDSAPYIRIYAITAGPTFTFVSHTTALNVQLTDGVTSVNWLPDSSGVTFGIFSSPFEVSYTVAGSGTGITLTKWANPSSLPAGSPNDVAWDSTGVYLALAVDTSPFINIYSRSGTTLTKLSNPASIPTVAGYSVEWTGTDYLAWAASGSPSLFVYYHTGTTFTKLSDPATMPTNIFSASWDPTGTYLTLSGGGTTFNTYKKAGTGASATLTKLSDPSGTPGASAGIGDGAAWSPLGTYYAHGKVASPYVFIYTASGTPNAPVLSSSVTGTPKRCVLIWTTPGSGASAIQGYNVTETNEYGGVAITNYGLVNTASFIPHTRTWSYTVHAWNGNGNSTESNSATCVQAPMNLTGQNGAIYGGDRASLASGWGVPTGALDLTLAILIIIILGGAGWTLIRPAPAIGAGVFACIGFFLDIALRLIPIWVVFFFLVVIGAVFLIARAKGAGGD